MDFLEKESDEDSDEDVSIISEDMKELVRALMKPPRSEAHSACKQTQQLCYEQEIRKRAAPMIDNDHNSHGESPPVEGSESRQQVVSCHKKSCACRKGKKQKRRQAGEH